MKTINLATSYTQIQVELEGYKKDLEQIDDANDFACQNVRKKISRAKRELNFIEKELPQLMLVTDITRGASDSYDFKLPIGKMRFFPRADKLFMAHNQKWHTRGIKIIREFIGSKRFDSERLAQEKKEGKEQL